MNEKRAKGRIKLIMIFINMIILMSVLNLSVNCFAKIDLDAGIELDQKTFIDQALINDSEFTMTLQQYLQSKYAAISSQEIADWTLDAQAALNHYETTSTSSNSADADSISYEVGLQKLFLTSGTRLSLAHSNHLTETELSQTRSESSTPQVTLAVMQPLLKNAFGLYDRYPVIAAEIQKKSAYDDVLEAWENRLAELEKAYLAWCNAYENVKAYQAILKEITRFENSVRRKFKAGVSDEKDMVQAEENLLQYQSALIKAETTYRNETLNIASLQTGKIIGNGDAPSIRPNSETRAMAANEVLDEKAIQTLRLVRKITFLREQQLYQKKIADNSALPTLDLVGSYSLKGEGPERTGGYETINDHQDYTVMLEASMPLGGYKSRGDKGQADAALREIEASYQNTIRSLGLGIKQMAANIHMLEETLAIQEKLVNKAERKLVLDNHNYEIGRLDIYYLIDTQNGLTNARLNYIKNKIQLDQLKLDYLAMTDNLLTLYPEFQKKLQP